MTKARRVTAASIAIVAALVLLLGGTGGNEPRVALAVTSTSWDAQGRLVVHTECAHITRGSISRTAVAPDAVPQADAAPGATPPTITLWGSPRVGRCRPAVVVALPVGTTKIVDAATSQVIDLPPRPRP